MLANAAYPRLKKPADCDDNNPCTADLCTASKGCTHTALAKGASCGASKTCDKSLCK